MARQCVLTGCGKPIEGFKKYFCSLKCKNQDYADRVRRKRAKLLKRKRQPRNRRMWVRVAGKKVGVLQLKTAFEIGKLAERELAANAKKGMALVISTRGVKAKALRVQRELKTKKKAR